MCMLKRKLRIGLDCDDVLYECNSYALMLLNAERAMNGKPPLRFDEINSWGPTGTDVDDRLKYFNDADFFRNQPVMKGAREFVKRLVDMGHEIFLITTLPYEFRDIRMKKIAVDFPEIPPENIFVVSRKDMFSVDLMLDDGPHNLVGERRIAARYPVLFRKPWNTSVCGIRAISTYDDFINLLHSLSGSVTRGDYSDDHKVFCLVGPSGTGKTDLANELVKNPFYARVKACTTKQTASEDVYEILSDEEFSNAQFVERSVYNGYQYGIRTSVIERIWADGKNAVAYMDITGAFSLKRIYGDNKVVVVFCKRNISDIIRNIMMRDISSDEKVTKIAALNVELEGEDAADIVLYQNDAKKSAEHIFGLMN